MRGWLGAVGRELRHGTCVGGFLAMAVLLATLLWMHSSSWGARWNHLGVQVREDMILLAPLAVVLGAWQGGRARRSEVEELLGSTRRSFLARQSAEVVALGVALFAGVMLGYASAAWTIVWTGGYGTWAAAAYVVGAFPALLADVAIGHLVGRLLVWRFVAPIAGVLTYIALGFLLWDNNSRPVLWGGGWLGGMATSAFDTDAWAWGLAVGAAATVGLLGLGAFERRPARSTGWIGAAAAGLGLVVLAAPAALGAMDAAKPDYPQVSDPALACTHDGGPRACVFEQDRHQLDEATVQARAMLRRLRGIPGAPTWAGPSVDDHDGSRLNVWVGETTPWGDPEPSQANPYVSYLNLFAPDSCPPARGSDSVHLPGDPDGTAFGGSDLVAEWLEGSAGGDEPHGASAELRRRFAASTDAQRRAYAGRLHQAAVECDPAAARAAIDVLGPA